jgi:hypothetical protein
MIEGLGPIGLGYAGSIIQSNPGKEDKTEKFSEMFSNDGVRINSFNDFFAWRMDILTEKLRKLLEELKKMAAEMRKSIVNGASGIQDLSSQASESLTLFAEENGVDLTSATLGDIESLISKVEGQISLIGKVQASGLTKKGNTNSTTGNLKEPDNSGQDLNQLTIDQLA